MLFEGGWVSVSFVHVPHPLVITFLFDQQPKEVKCPAFKVLGPSLMSVFYLPHQNGINLFFFLAFKKNVYFALDLKQVKRYTRPSQADVSFVSYKK